MKWQYRGAIFCKLNILYICQKKRLNIHISEFIIYVYFAPSSFSGIQLLEHDEVLFSYYGKVNVQEAAINERNMALETLEKEMTDLQIALNEDRRQIDLKRKEVPLHKKLEGEITMLHIQVGRKTTVCTCHAHFQTPYAICQKYNSHSKRRYTNVYKLIGCQSNYL